MTGNLASETFHTAQPHTTSSETSSNKLTHNLCGRTQKPHSQKKPCNLHRTLGEQGKNGGKERRGVQGGGWVSAEGAPDEKETKELNQLGTPSSEPKRSNYLTKGTIKVSRMKLESASCNMAYEVRQII